MRKQRQDIPRFGSLRRSMPRLGKVRRCCPWVGPTWDVLPFKLWNQFLKARHCNARQGMPQLGATGLGVPRQGVVGPGIACLGTALHHKARFLGVNNAQDDEL